MYEKSKIQISYISKIFWFQCGMGMAHSLFIARCDTDDEKKALEKYEILDQTALDK